MHTPLVVDLTEAAEILRLGRTKLYELLNAGELPSFKVGARRLIAVQDLEAYVARLRAGGAQ